MALRICLQSPCLAHKALARLVAALPRYSTFYSPAWTQDPVKWDNSFFKTLYGNKWKKFKGPGGKYQWKNDGDPILAKAVAPGLKKQPVGMLTSDVALLHDPSYRELVKMFAKTMTPRKLPFPMHGTS